MPRPFLIILVAAGPLSAADLPKDQLDFFESKVRPVLAEHCYSCHSAAGGKSKGGLTLDTVAGWKKGGESGPALVPGDPEKSLLIAAVRHSSAELRMPAKAEKLGEAEIAALEQWVKMGAPDPRTVDAKPVKATASGMTEEMKVKAANHWAFQPVREPSLPEVNDKAWPANPIDRFVLAKLEERNLKPSDAADKRTLIRRAFLDLTGLPPTPDEVLAFVRDESPTAFEKVIDTLLGRPQYGERWGRFWLDVARYADTRGRVRNQQTPLNPHAWTYRDYVINALNADKPFDQFIKEQIAADLLPQSDDKTPLAALGFLTQGDQFNGQKLDIINDQIDVVTKGFLGLTVTCARCHDHFFDPITQRDYYALSGIFSSCIEPDEKPVITRPASDRASAEFQSQRAEMEAAGRRELVAAMDRLSDVFNRNAETFLGLTLIDRRSPEFYQYIQKSRIDGRLANEVAQYLVRRKAAGRNRRGAERNPLVNPVLDAWHDFAALPRDGFAAGAAKVMDALEQDTAGIRSNRAVRAAFRGRSVQSIDDVKQIYGTVFANASDLYQKEREAWRKSDDNGKNSFPGLSDAALEEVRCAVLNPRRFLRGEIEENGRGLPREVQQLANRILGDLAKLDVSHPGSPGLANVMHDASRPRNANILIRGQMQNPGPLVPRSFLEVLSGGTIKAFHKGSGRYELAESIASKDNPLTARVTMNRVWMHHFGEGLVSTPDDHGVQSEAPTHPELLDWLAHRFMAGGWSLKQMHRTILLSMTWQQSSEPNAEFAKIDPFNKLLWRQNVRKLEFEALRDSILFMGGRLDLTMGGRPVNIESEPYSPRRSVYAFIDRNEMAEFMRHFDVANPALPSGKRHTTIVPQQALFRMNSLLVLEQARNIVARKDFTSCHNDEQKVRKLYEIIFQRWPKPPEIQLAHTFLKSLPAGGETQPPATRLALQQDNTREAEEPDPSKMTRGQRKESQREQRRAEAMARKMEMQNNKRGGTAGVKEAVRDPNAEKVDRSPLNAWEKYAHALLMTSEVGYVN